MLGRMEWRLKRIQELPKVMSWLDACCFPWKAAHQGLSAAESTGKGESSSLDGKSGKVLCREQLFPALGLQSLESCGHWRCSAWRGVLPVMGQVSGQCGMDLERG